MNVQSSGLQAPIKAVTNTYQNQMAHALSPTLKPQGTQVPPQYAPSKGMSPMQPAGQFFAFGVSNQQNYPGVQNQTRQF
jgi:hypothetical protein